MLRVLNMPRSWISICICIWGCGGEAPGIDPIEPTNGSDASIVPFNNDDVRPTSAEIDVGLPDQVVAEADVDPCEMEEMFFEGACYSAPGIKGMTFEVARQVCLSRDAQVASIHSADENAFVFSLLPLLNQGAWIGLRRTDSAFAWDNGDQSDFIEWAEGEPNNEGGAEDCVIMWGPNLKSHPEWQGQWNDASCEDAQDTVICKRLPQA